MGQGHVPWRGWGWEFSPDAVISVGNVQTLFKGVKDSDLYGQWHFYCPCPLTIRLLFHTQTADLFKQTFLFRRERKTSFCLRRHALAANYPACPYSVLGHSERISVPLKLPSYPVEPSGWKISALILHRMLLGSWWASCCSSLFVRLHVCSGVEQAMSTWTKSTAPGIFASSSLHLGHYQAERT